MRKSTKHKILFFFLVLIGLIAGYTALYISVSRFNEKERTMPVYPPRQKRRGKMRVLPLSQGAEVPIPG